MRQRLVIGNWKMHGGLTSNAVLLHALKANYQSEIHRCSIGLCVPTPYLAQCQDELKNSAFAWGAQDISAHLPGAYTGEIAAGMLLDFGCRFVLVGHSERRTLHGETDTLIAAKVQRALEASLTPVVCVGETEQQQAAGQTKAVIAAQLEVLIKAFKPAELAKIVLAYEPVWAIGTGKTATPAMAQEVHAMLRAQLAKVKIVDTLIDKSADKTTNKIANNIVNTTGSDLAQSIPILYGGSVKAENARDLFTMPDIDGALVGGASLNANEFLAIAACN